MREKVLMALLQAGQGPLSGEALGERLGISRVAVWKHIDALRQAGYGIESLPHSGYRLTDAPDRLDAPLIQVHLTGRHMGRALVSLDQADSTNLAGKRLAAQGCPHGQAVVTDCQSAGRGRRGRDWISPPGVNIYLSVVFKLPLPPQRAPLITLLMAEAVCQVLLDMGYDAGIKWPNDVVVGGRKVAGILTEMSADLDQLHWAVAGVGINANWRDLPEDIAQRATSLAEAGGARVDRAALTARVLDALEAGEGLLSDPPRLLERLRAHSVTLGRMVRVEGVGETFTGRAEAMDAEGALLVRREDGALCRVLAGDVSVRGLMGYAQ